MNIQGNNSEQTPFKITFSNINCKITLSDSAVFAFVIRLGKKSSKYTEKKRIQNGFLKLDSVLQVPFDQKLLQNGRKQKCEIMLYKFKLEGQKRSEQLIGMASVVVSQDMFNQQFKKLRLTNSFDKEAYVQCVVRIQLGEADLVSSNESRISSFLIKLEENFGNEKGDSIIQEVKQSAIRNKVREGLATSQSRLSLRQGFDQMRPENSFVQTLKTQSNYDTNSPQSQWKFETQVEGFTQPTVCSEQQSSEKKILQEEQQKLIKICNNLQKQNMVLMEKVQNLENRMLNQSIISNKSSTITDNINIPRPAGTIRRSSMIKKNNAIAVTSFPKKVQQNEQIFSLSNVQNQSQSKNTTLFESQETVNISQVKISRSSSIAKDLPLFFPNQQKVRQSQISTKIQSNVEVDTNMPLTKDEIFRKDKRLCILPVIDITYTPPVNSFPNHDNFINDRQNSIINNSVSDFQRKNSRSYTKFGGKKKYQQIGAIKSLNQSQNASYFENQSEENPFKRGSIVLKKPFLMTKRQQQNSLNGKKSDQSQLKILKSTMVSPKETDHNVILDFLNEKDQNSFIKYIEEKEDALRSQEMKENIQNDRTAELVGQRRQRITLQELDIKTQERFRKNERALKKANMKILQENIDLKKKMKILQEQIHQKKQLSSDVFTKLRSQIQFLTRQAEFSSKAKTDSESKLNQVSVRCKIFEQENIKLKKELKEQKSRYEYYLKMSNVNDDKEKQLSRLKDFSMHQKRTPLRIFTNLSNSIDQTKNTPKNPSIIPSIVNLNTKEESIIMKGLFEAKLLNKAQSSYQNKFGFKSEQDKKSYVGQTEMEKKNSQNHKADISKPTSSTVVSQIKQHSNSGIPRHSAYNQNRTSVNHGLANHTFSMPIAQQYYRSALLGGFSGTGQTIIRDPLQINRSFSQK